MTNTTTDPTTQPMCSQCGETYSAQRLALGYRLCLTCGDTEARRRTFTVAPMHKSNYMLFTDMADLKGINNKGGFHR